ncbi:hypothetical protein TrRE_jg5146, partial [Triparma retinervis]
MDGRMDTRMDTRMETRMDKQGDKHDELEGWTMMEDNRGKKNKSFTTIEKIDKFNGIDTPLLRFRTTIKSGTYKQSFVQHFANLIMKKPQRSPWDPACESVSEVYPLDLAVGNSLFSSSSPSSCGVLTRLGVGHCTTKPAAGGLVSPREQLTLCGINEFPTGGGVVWGYECPPSM